MKHHYLITTYNNADFIEAAFESIRRQYVTLEEFFTTARVLIVDDASIDGTTEKIDQIVRRCRNTLSYRNPTNRGAGHNRNILLNWLMSGNVNPDDLVTFVDGDDMLPDDAMKVRIDEFMTDPELDCIGGQISVIDTNAQKIGRMDTFSVDPQMAAIAELFECHFYISNALFRARVFKDPSVRFPNSRVSADWLFFISNRQIKRRHSHATTLLYRRHTTNLTNPLAPQGARRNEGDSLRARQAVRTVGLLSLGLLYTEREYQLMDMVGYLTLQLRWCGQEAVFDPGIQMPWFIHLRTIPEVEKNWPAVRHEIAALFERISQANRMVARFDQSRLDAFLSALLDAADQTLRDGRAHLSMVPPSQVPSLHPRPTETV